MEFKIKKGTIEKYYFTFKTAKNSLSGVYIIKNEPHSKDSYFEYIEEPTIDEKTTEKIESIIITAVNKEEKKKNSRKTTKINQWEVTLSKTLEIKEFQLFFKDAQNQEHILTLYEVYDPETESTEYEIVHDVPGLELDEKVIKEIIKLTRNQ